MARLFGTDGVRGVAGTELTSLLAMNIGIALAYILKRNNENVKVLIGNDTRISKDMIVNSISAGLSSKGVTVVKTGVIPTPAISYLVRKHNFQAGIMVTASHNPYEFNGIKIFDKNGFKLEDVLEDEIEEIVNKIESVPKTSEIGTIEEDTTLINDYISYLISKKEHDFSNLRIALDCANGSSSKTARKVFESFNCKTFIINDQYNGININENAGSTHINILKDYVIKNKCDVGFSFDGDADRCIAIDNEGNIIDGDYVLAIIGMYLKEQGKLKNNSIVGTIMSNLGLIKFCKDNDINFVSTKVGDRYVLEEMLVNNYSIGGEQSGHTIFMEHANTGDGELTAIELLNVITGTNKSLNELSKVMKKYPQVLINTPVSNDKKNNFYTDNVIIEEIKKYEEKLNETGRIVIRPSGTEPLIRVMIEGENEKIIKEYAQKLADFIKEKMN